MSTPKRACQKCGSSYRGTRDPEERLCARCTVLHCQVPENIDDVFLNLVKEYYKSPSLSPSSILTLPLEGILLITEDILDHRKRLEKLESELKSRKQDKGKMRLLREVKRLKEEKDVMEETLKGLKSKFMLFILTLPTRHQKAMADENSTKSSSVSSTPSKASPLKNSSKAEVGQTPVITMTTDSPQRRSPPRKTSSPKKEEESQLQSQPQPQPPLAKDTLQVEEPAPVKTSPVKQAAAKFEEAAKRVKSVVTFATPNRSIRRERNTPGGTPKEVTLPRKVEVNNNTPVTASSSSEDDDEVERTGQLKRSNSVRDRIKRFEDLQRRASTGSYDRKMSKAGGGGLPGKHKSMMPLSDNQ